MVCEKGKNGWRTVSTRGLRVGMQRGDEREREESREEGMERGNGS